MSVLIGIGTWLWQNPAVVATVLGLFGVKKVASSARFQKIMKAVDQVFDWVELLSQMPDWKGDKKALFFQALVQKLRLIGIKLTEDEQVKVSDYIYERARVTPSSKGKK